MLDVDVTLNFAEEVETYLPGRELDCSYQVVGTDLENVHAIETSILWRTEGKGSEDIGIHFFKRQTKKDLVDLDARSVQRIAVQLPKSPLSYNGVILSLRWLVRVKLFFKKGKPRTFDFPFALGQIYSPERIDVTNNLLNSSNDELGSEP